MFADDFIDVLVALRALHLPLYMQVMRAHHEDQETLRGGIARVQAESARSASDPPALTDLLAGEPYRQLLQRLNQSDPTAAARVQIVLETKEYEQRLSRLKTRSLQEYVDELRVVGADELVAALRGGTIVNAVDEDGDPLPIRSDEGVSAAFLDRPTATACVSADLLVRVLNDFAGSAEGLVANAQGLRLRQVVVIGAVNLNWLDLPFPLGFEGCDFHGWIWAEHLRVPWLSFDSCDFTPHGHRVPSSGALNAGSIAVRHELRFWGCRGINQLFIPDARIGLYNPAGPATGPEDAEPTGTTGWQPTPFRTVIDGATFERLIIPEDGASGLEVTRSVRIGSLTVLGPDGPQQVAERLFGWLVAPEDDGTDPRVVPTDVWREFEGALRRSGHSAAATHFGYLGADQRTRSEGVKGRLKRAVLKPTTHYFYDNLRAVWGLGLLLVVAWVSTLLIALLDPDQLAQSPLANPSTLPEDWIASFLDSTVWSLLYAVDLVVSPISLGQADVVWPHSVWLTLWFAAIKGVSLILLGLFLVGVTGLAERRDA
jgi:hypothetical protein